MVNRLSTAPKPPPNVPRPRGAIRNSEVCPITFDILKPLANAIEAIHQQTIELDDSARKHMEQYYPEYGSTPSNTSEVVMTRPPTNAEIAAQLKRLSVVMDDTSDILKRADIHPKLVKDMDKLHTIIWDMARELDPPPAWNDKF